MNEITKDYLVRLEDSALKMGSGDMEVLASPALVAMAENLSKILCSSYLENGETTVGIAFSLEHVKATAVGETIQLTAKLIENSGRSYRFEISAKHKEQVIAKANHQRVVVNIDRFLAKL